MLNFRLEFYNLFISHFYCGLFVCQDQAAATYLCTHNSFICSVGE